MQARGKACVEAAPPLFLVRQLLRPSSFFLLRLFRLLPSAAVGGFFFFFSFNSLSVFFGRPSAKHCGLLSGPSKNVAKLETDRFAFLYPMGLTHAPLHSAVLIPAKKSYPIPTYLSNTEGGETCRRRRNLHLFSNVHTEPNHIIPDEQGHSNNCKWLKKHVSFSAFCIR